MRRIAAPAVVAICALVACGRSLAIDEDTPHVAPPADAGPPPQGQVDATSPDGGGGNGAEASTLDAAATVDAPGTSCNEAPYQAPPGQFVKSAAFEDGVVGGANGVTSFLNFGVVPECRHKSRYAVRSLSAEPTTNLHFDFPEMREALIVFDVLLRGAPPSGVESTLVRLSGGYTAELVFTAGGQLALKAGGQVANPSLTLDVGRWFRMFLRVTEKGVPPNGLRFACGPADAPDTAFIDTGELTMASALDFFAPVVVEFDNIFIR